MIFFQGFMIGAGLIIAIGAQNAFVLSQGIKRQHTLLVPAICTTCDAVLIGLGVSGMGVMVGASPALSAAASLGGAALLFWYGLTSFHSAFRDNRLDTGNTIPDTLRNVILTTLGLTLLNPHVYLDTVVLLGSIGARFPEDQRPLFGIGAMTASLVWFFSLSLGGRLLAPLFAKTISWKILDAFVGVTMWAIAASLIKDLTALL